MSISTSERRWLIPFGLLLLGNLLFSLNSSMRLNRMEESLAGFASHQDDSGNNPSKRLGSVDGAPSNRSSGPLSDTADNPQDLINSMLEFKARAAAIPPATLATELENQLSREPALPEVEQRSSQWLSNALARMPADAPEAENVQTTCRGRRCEVTAYFGSDTDARTWATHYLLASGGQVLARASTVILPPPAGTDGVFTLQLHLY